MAEKTNQHYVPQVFLKAFCDPQRPVTARPDAPYQPSVWLIPKSLRGQPKRRAPKNVLRAKRAYNLATDNPKEPLLENALSKLEWLYDRLLPRLECFEELSIEEYSTLVVFIGALYTRNLENIEHWKMQFG
jgi:hypothetical protein